MGNNSLPMSLSGRILVGLLVGIATGLFFGEIVADLKLLGDVFVKLLQITVLPYIIVSLIAGFGRLQMEQAKQLALRGSIVLLAIWALALGLIFIAAMAFPDIETASFFSAPSRVEVERPDLFELYLPANIFYSLSNNLVPAVVFFSILVGVAMINWRTRAAYCQFLTALQRPCHVLIRQWCSSLLMAFLQSQRQRLEQ